MKRKKSVMALPFLFGAILIFSGFMQSAEAALPRKTFRVLIVVTPSAYQDIGSVNVRSFLQDNVITYPNNVYLKSPDSALIQLAGIYKNKYVEGSTMDIDMDSLHSWWSNSSNILYSLGNLYSADIVTMIEGVGDGGRGNCGATSRDQAYSCVWSSGLRLMQHLAAHEIGHIFGCTHDTADYPSTCTWPYAHGYIAPNGQWGTVMAIITAPGIIHIPYYSNPDSTYSDGQKRGNAHCNNTLVINNRIGLVAGFSNTPSTATVSNRTWRANEYGDVLASSSIAVSGVDSVKDTAELSLRSTGPITINSGFTVTSGGKLTVNSGSQALAKRAAEGPGSRPPPIVSAPSDLKIFASTVNRQGLVTVTCELTGAQPVRIRVFDTRGRFVLERNLGIQQAGRHVYSMNLGEPCAASLYMVEFAAGSHKERIKLVGDR